MRSRRTIAYAVFAASAVVLTVVVGWLTTPDDEGVAGEWETTAVEGRVLGGRALVATDSTVAIDLVSGTRITLGSVSGGDRAIGGGRLLIVNDTTLDAAGLDGQSRWTWRGPTAHRLALVAASSGTTVVQACGGTPRACRLIGLGANGQEAWQTPQPTASGTAAPVVGTDGNLPVVGVFPTGDDTVVLVDPDSSRVVLRPPARASVGRDGRLLLDSAAGGSCTRTTYESFDRSATSTAPGACPDAAAQGASDQTDQTNGAGTRAEVGRTTLWWWPFGDGIHTLEVSGRHTGRIVSRDGLRALRVDDSGITVAIGDVVRRYSWVNSPAAQGK
ncbi:hypothetical protein N802_13185 [Knoellia sinensis KCTC 19936]|uniref:Uncharacterized protein n=1 Tax=Knoellia sinensis KCTC 19936 TaxID=1385520 RepID=A0A0A0JAH6_9MICO|nr:hypothetical protein [Knoellia sinensis]KGN34430.1 hypothetical protein N802_13185 [Knoellia sinensis KCTC 19936]